LIPEPQQGVNAIGSAESLINDTGLVRIRLSGENMQGCFFVDLGLEATRN
jgi:hypothetical protein